MFFLTFYLMCYWVVLWWYGLCTFLFIFVELLRIIWLTVPPCGDFWLLLYLSPHLTAHSCPVYGLEEQTRTYKLRLLSTTSPTLYTTHFVYSCSVKPVLFCAASKQSEWCSQVAASLCQAAEAGRVSTWWDEEGPPQLLITRHISDLPRHVDESPCHRGHSPEVKDPIEREGDMQRKVRIKYLKYTSKS